MSKKSNLFKFVTLRNPQLLDEDRKEQGFVFHPELSATTSRFYQAVQPEDPYGKLIQNCDLFNDALLNKKAVTDVFPKLYKFAFWLSKNKNILTIENIVKQLDGAENITQFILSEENLKIAWDNLVYQTVKNTNKLVRESLIQILVADKFLTALRPLITGNSAISEFNDALLLEYKRRATANVVIPQEFLPTVTKSVDTPLRLSSVLTDRLAKGLDTAMAQRRTMQYKNQLHNIKLEELNAHEAVRIQKDQYMARVKTHRETTGLIPLLDVDGNDTGKKTYSPLPDGDEYVEPTITKTATTVVDERITTATRSTVDTTFFRIG